MSEELVDKDARHREVIEKLKKHLNSKKEKKEQKRGFMIRDLIGDSSPTTAPEIPAPSNTEQTVADNSVEPRARSRVSRRKEKGGKKPMRGRIIHSHEQKDSSEGSTELDGPCGPVEKEFLADALQISLNQVKTWFMKAKGERRKRDPQLTAKNYGKDRRMATIMRILEGRRDDDLRAAVLLDMKNDEQRMS